MAYPHTQSTGKHVYTKIVRNGSDMGYLHANKYYNPKFQNYYHLSPRIELKNVNFFYYFKIINFF